MDNYNKYKEIFYDIFESREIVLDDQFTLDQVEAWDSVCHLNLVVELENAFDLMLESDDILDFNSFTKGIELLKKYDVDVTFE